MTAEVAASARRALADARNAAFWSDRTDAPAPRPRLTGATEADPVIIGTGFTGLWAAMFATAEAGRRVVVLEAAHIGHGASSRNGGFCDSSLTHGLHNGALVDPARLAWGLADVVGTRGATVHDSSAVTAVEPDGRHLVVHTPDRRGGRCGIGFDS